MGEKSVKIPLRYDGNTTVPIEYVERLERENAQQYETIAKYQAHQQAGRELARKFKEVAIFDDEDYSISQMAYHNVLTHLEGPAKEDGNE